MPILANLAYRPIAYDVPRGAAAQQAKAIYTGLLDWTAATSYTLDTTQSNQLLCVQNIQSVSIDNSASSGVTSVQVSGTGHVLRVAPGAVAALPLLTSDRPVLTFSNTSGRGSTRAWVSNVIAAGVNYSAPVSGPNILVNPSTINQAPWFSSGAGASVLSATTFQTSTGASSLGQNLTVTAGATYTVSVTVACASGSVFVALYSTDYGTQYGSQNLLGLSSTPQTVTFAAHIPAGVTGAVFELDFSSTAGAVATITNAAVTGV